jgi:hypothetical protein
MSGRAREPEMEGLAPTRHWTGQAALSGLRQGA